MSEPTPLACCPGTLGAGENELRRRLFDELRASRVAGSVSSRRLSWQIRKSKGAIAAAGQLIALESQCCPFLGFALSIDPEEDAFSLTVTGPEGTDELLRHELAGGDL